MVKKAEHWRIDAFELCYWRRLLRVPWTERRSNQSIIKEISPGCSLEGLMLKLKLQYFDNLMWRIDSLEKTLMLGRIGDRRKRGQQRMRCQDGITDLMDVGLGRLWELVMDREAWHTIINGVSKSWTQLSNWTELNPLIIFYLDDLSIEEIRLLNFLIIILLLWVSSFIFINICYIYFAAAAKLLQSRPTLCNPIDSSPPDSSVPGILQAIILGWVAISFSNACMHAKPFQSCPTLCDSIDSSPPGSPVYGILQARNTGGGCHFPLPYIL